MHSPETVESGHNQRNHDNWLWLTALGIVYGDLVAFLYRNSVKVVDRFNLPSRNVVEIARKIEV